MSGRDSNLKVGLKEEHADSSVSSVVPQSDSHWKALKDRGLISDVPDSTMRQPGYKQVNAAEQELDSLIDSETDKGVDELDSVLENSDTNTDRESFDEQFSMIRELIKRLSSFVFELKNPDALVVLKALKDCVNDIQKKKNIGAVVGEQANYAMAEGSYASKKKKADEWKPEDMRTTVPDWADVPKKIKKFMAGHNSFKSLNESNWGQVEDNEWDSIKKTYEWQSDESNFSDDPDQRNGSLKQEADLSDFDYYRVVYLNRDDEQKEMDMSLVKGKGTDPESFWIEKRPDTKLISVVKKGSLDQEDFLDPTHGPQPVDMRANSQHTPIDSSPKSSIGSAGLKKKAGSYYTKVDFSWDEGEEEFVAKASSLTDNDELNVMISDVLTELGFEFGTGEWRLFVDPDDERALDSSDMANDFVNLIPDGFAADQTGSGLEVYQTGHLEASKKMAFKKNMKMASQKFWIDPNGKFVEVPGDQLHEDLILDKEFGTSEQAIGQGWVRGYASSAELGLELNDKSKVDWALKNVPQALKFVNRLLIDTIDSTSVFDVAVEEDQDALDAWTKRKQQFASKIRKKLANDDIKKYLKIDNIIVAIEWEEGETRKYDSGFEQLMKNDYGYVVNTTSPDGEEIDVYIGSTPNDKVYKITQLKDNGNYDEDKFMLNFADDKDALSCYLAHMPFEKFGGLAKLSWPEFETICHTSQDKKGLPIVQASSGFNDYALSPDGTKHDTNGMSHDAFFSSHPEFGFAMGDDATAAGWTCVSYSKSIGFTVRSQSLRNLDSETKDQIMSRDSELTWINASGRERHYADAEGVEDQLY